MVKIDLHIHTHLSDGDLSVDEIVSLAHLSNCRKIAITDHEIMNDYSNLCNSNFQVINGIEFNTSIRGMHILGYGIINIKLVRKILADLHQENENVSYRLINILATKGFDISKEQVLTFLSSRGLKCDYLDKRHIVKYLISKGYTKDVKDTYDNLIGRGTDLYLPLKKITPKEIIDLINSCGGVSVLAHPDTLGLLPKELLIQIKELVTSGLDGIEIINGNTLNEHTSYYHQIARDLNLVETVGSDFHSLDKQCLGIECDDTIYDELVQRIYCKNKDYKN